MKQYSSVLFSLLIAGTATVGCGIFEHKINNKAKIDKVEEDLQNENKKQDDLSKVDSARQDANLTSAEGRQNKKNASQDKIAADNLAKQKTKNDMIDTAIVKVNKDLVDAKNELSTEIKKTQDNLGALKADYNSFVQKTTDKFTETELKLSEQNSQLAEQHNRLVEHQVAIDKTNAEIAKTNQKLASEVGDLNKRVDGVKESAEKALSDLKTARTDLDNLTKKVDNDTASKAALAELKSSMETTLGQHNSSIESLKGAQSTLNGVIEGMRTKQGPAPAAADTKDMKEAMLEEVQSSINLLAQSKYSSQGLIAVYNEMQSINPEAQTADEDLHIAWSSFLTVDAAARAEAILYSAMELNAAAAASSLQVSHAAMKTLVIAEAPALKVFVRPAKGANFVSTEAPAAVLTATTVVGVWEHKSENKDSYIRKLEVGKTYETFGADSNFVKFQIVESNGVYSIKLM